MNRRRLLERINRGRVTNIAFADLENLLDGLGFELVRTRGSHRVYAHPTAGAILSLQEAAGQAKPYQVRQLRRIVEEYDLTVED